MKKLLFCLIIAFTGIACLRNTKSSFGNCNTSLSDSSQPIASIIPADTIIYVKALFVDVAGTHWRVGKGSGFFNLKDAVAGYSIYLKRGDEIIFKDYCYPKELNSMIRKLEWYKSRNADKDSLGIILNKDNPY